MTDKTVYVIQTAGFSSEITATEKLQQLNPNSNVHTLFNIKTQESEQNTPCTPSIAEPTELTNHYTTAGTVPVKVKDTREGRKFLPPIPDSEVEATMSASVTSKQYDPAVTGAGSYGQIHLEYILMTEYNSLYKQKLPGIYVIPSALSPLIWNGVIFIRQGLYQEAVFRFNLNIPENYPNGECPRVFFEFPVFHPIVDPKTGELDVVREFKKWRRNANYLWQVLLYVRRIFFKIDPKCPLNAEAADMYEHNMDQFKQKVVETIKSCKDVLYNPIESYDAHMIRFAHWNDSVHEDAKSDILTRKKNQNNLESEPHKKNGLSWISPGTTQIFSKDDDAEV